MSRYGQLRDRTSRTSSDDGERKKTAQVWEEEGEKAMRFFGVGGEVTGIEL